MTLEAACIGAGGVSAKAGLWKSKVITAVAERLLIAVLSILKEITMRMPKRAKTVL
jgi:hypothetical protein